MRKPIKKKPLAPPGKPFYKKTWVVRLFWGTVISAVGAVLLSGTIMFKNIETLPSAYSSVQSKFLKWYFEDDAWNGYYTSFPEGYVNLEDMHLTDVDLLIQLESQEGHLGGTISSHKFCEAVPLLEWGMIEGKVNLLDTESAEFLVFDVIGGKTVNFAKLKLHRLGVVLEVSPIDDPLQLFPTYAKIATLPERSNNIVNDPYCTQKHKEQLAKIRRDTGPHVWRKKPK